MLTLCLLSMVCGFFKERWTVETFHQVWKSLFGTKNWRFQSEKAIQNLATVTVMAIGLAVYYFTKRHNNYYDLYELNLKNCLISVALAEIKEKLIRGKVFNLSLFQKEIE